MSKQSMQKKRNRRTQRVARASRKAGIHLFDSGKSVRPNAAGKHPQSRKPRDKPNAHYVVQKYIIKSLYGTTTTQLKKYCKEAKNNNKNNMPRNALINSLESRLSNVLVRGFGFTTRQAEQLTAHGKVKVNGKKVDIKSYKCKVGDVITLTEDAFGNLHVLMSIEKFELSGKKPQWLTYNKKEVVVSAVPSSALAENHIKPDFQSILQNFNR